MSNRFRETLSPTICCIALGMNLQMYAKFPITSTSVAAMDGKYEGLIGRDDGMFVGVTALRFRLDSRYALFLTLV